MLNHLTCSFLLPSLFFYSTELDYRACEWNTHKKYVEDTRSTCCLSCAFALLTLFAWSLIFLSQAQKTCVPDCSTWHYVEWWVNTWGEFVIDDIQINTHALTASHCIALHRITCDSKYARPSNRKVRACEMVNASRLSIQVWHLMSYWTTRVPSYSLVSTLYSLYSRERGDEFHCNWPGVHLGSNGARWITGPMAFQLTLANGESQHTEWMTHPAVAITCTTGLFLFAFSLCTINLAQIKCYFISSTTRSHFLGKLWGVDNTRTLVPPLARTIELCIGAFEHSTRSLSLSLSCCYFGLLARV